MSFLIENDILKKYTFDNNRNDVIIPDGVTEIGERAFQYADNIVSVTVPDGVKIIGSFAFSDCRNLAALILPESIIHIGQYAFNNCFKLPEINTLGQITRISEGTFSGCVRLTSITIPEGITHIGENAFHDCKLLTSLKLPDSVTVIDNNAFASCESLADFSIPPNVKKIGYYAFVGCRKLSEITIPEAIRIIEEGAFANCDGLKEINFHEAVQIIKNSAFNSCSGLRDITIPSSVREIEPYAFYACYNLRKVTLLSIFTDIMFNAFLLCHDMVTNYSVREWNKLYGIDKIDYIVHYMRLFEAGDEFFEYPKRRNKPYIRHQLHNILKRGSDDTPGIQMNPIKEDGILPNDTNVIVFLTNEIKLRLDEVDNLLDRMQGNVEASAILLDYKAKHFTKEYIEKYENDKLQKELGLKERTVAEWKKIYRLGDDGNGGYIILGYKGKDSSVEIPEKIGKRSVTALGDFAFSPAALYITKEMRSTRQSLETVIIPDSITTIGINIFKDCEKLDSIIYQGKTYTTVGFEYNFYPLCDNLR